MSDIETKKPKPRWWTPYWIIIVIATIVVGITLPFTQGISWEQAIVMLAFVLVFEGIAYYGRVRPSIRLNRVMYILLGAPIGFVLWFISALFLSRIYTQEPIEDVAIIVSVVVCFGIGALIGDMIGRLRHYKGPEQYQP